MSSSAISLKGALGRDALRNLLSNPAFDEWSRGISFGQTAPSGTIKLTNGPDAWFARYFPSNGTTTDLFVMEKKKHVLGQTDVEGNPTFYTRFYGGTIGAGTSGEEQITFSQRIPNVRIMQDKTVTLQFYAKGHTTDQKLAVGFTQVFGVSGGPDEFGDGGTASDPVHVEGQQVTLTQEWAKYTLQYNIPSITGKFIGTSGSNYTELNMFLHAGATAAKSTRRNLPGAIDFGATLDIGSVQLEGGVDASQMENISSSTPFIDMIGAQVTAIASGQVVRGVSGASDASQIAEYKGITTGSFPTAGETIYISLNDANGNTGNNILKYGQFFNTDAVTDPIFIVSPSEFGDLDGAATDDVEKVVCFATPSAGDKTILEVVSFNNTDPGGDKNAVFNVMAIQLGVAGSLLGGDQGTAGGGAADGAGSSDDQGDPGTGDGTEVEDPDEGDCPECQPL